MITPIYAAILGLMLVGLSIHVIKARRLFGTGIGDAQDIEMMRRIRAQANLAEYAPIFLIELACAEYVGAPHWMLNFIGVLFLFGRGMHAYSLLKAEQYERFKHVMIPVWRVRGMFCTFSALALLSVIILMLRFL